MSQSENAQPSMGNDCSPGAQQRLTSNKLYLEYASLTVVGVNGGQVLGSSREWSKAESQQVSKLVMIDVKRRLLVHGTRVETGDWLQTCYCSVDLTGSGSAPGKRVVNGEVEAAVVPGLTWKRVVLSDIALSKLELCPARN